MLMNKDLFLEGIQYISASQAAKKIGYAGDYVGQLCRDGKVPSRMIGRTWYVDFQSLLEYKKTNKTKKKKAEEIKLVSKQTSFVAAPVEKKSEENILPELSKNIPQKFEIPTKSRLNEVKIAPKIEQKVEAVVLRDAKPVLSVVKVRKPIAARAFVAMMIVAVIVGGSYAFQKVLNQRTSNLATVAVQKTLPVNNTSAEGMVVMPDSADHAGLVAKVRSFFSDDVTVTFDEENDSGVITPVFHEGDDTEHYAFLMVPVNRTQ